MSISPLALSGVFLFGLMVGSFLNVCIWRLPEGEQIVRGRSHCRHCRREIRWIDNIPLVSFVLLKGRCRFCGLAISWSYPAVELLTGLLLTAVAARFGWTMLAGVYGLFAAALIVLSMVDLKEMILPDEITLPGLSLGVICSYFVPEMHDSLTRWSGLWMAVLGALVGGGVVWIIGVVGTWLFKREAMGFGDVKLMAMVGAFIGWKNVLLVNFILAPVLGALVGVVLKFRYGRDLIPYGPFLTLATLAALFWGNEMIGRYLSLL